MALAQELEPTAVRQARAAVADVPPVTLVDVAAQLRVGSFLKPLPQLAGGVARFAMTMLSLATQVDPSWLDRPPRCETRFGEIPVLLPDRLELLTELALHPKGRGGDDGRLIRAALLLAGHLDTVAEAWRVKIASLWRRLRDTETIAADYLSMYLSHNLVVAAAERDRYFYPGGNTPRATSDDFRGLVRAIRTVAAGYRAAQIDEVRTEQRVVTAVAMATNVIAIASILNATSLVNPGNQLNRAAWDAIGWATQLTDAAARNAAEAMTGYLMMLRRAARAHPVVLVLDHRRLAGSTVLDVGRVVAEALTDAESAIVRLRTTGVNREVIPSQRRAQDVTPSGLAERLADADPVSVWKLPFFVEQALVELPPDQALEIKTMLTLATRIGEGKAIGQGFALLGIGTAAALAPAVGPIGVALALAWGLFQLGSSIRDYQQLSDLFHATLDPEVLLRGLDHEEAGKLGIVLDLLGLIVW